MVKRKQKKRGLVKRERRRILLLGLEGKNKTEKLYFSEFNHLQKKFVIRFASGNKTDPLQLVQNLEKDIHKQDLNLKDWDMAFAVFDVDNDIGKQRSIEEAKQIAGKKGIKLIPSNPCFEVWFLLHFEYSTAYCSNLDALQKLCKYVENYDKSCSCFNQIHPYLNTAIHNSKKLRKYHSESMNTSIFKQNPMTDVDKIIGVLNLN